MIKGRVSEKLGLLYVKVHLKRGCKEYIHISCGRSELSGFATLTFKEGKKDAFEDVWNECKEPDGSYKFIVVLGKGEDQTIDEALEEFKMVDLRYDGDTDYNYESFTSEVIPRFMKDYCTAHSFIDHE